MRLFSLSSAPGPRGAHLPPAVRLSAILPWFAFLFGLTSTVLSFLESRDARRHSHVYPVSSSGIDREDIKEKDAAQVGQNAV